MSAFDDVNKVCIVTFSVENLVLDHENLLELIGQLANRSLSQLAEERYGPKEHDLFVKFLLLNLAKDYVEVMFREHSEVSLLQTSNRSHPWLRAV